MSKTSMLRSGIVAAALAICLAGPSSAATLTFSSLVSPTVNPFAFAKSANVTENDATDISGVRVGPRGNNVFAYTSVGADGFATYNFGLAKALQVVWGTPDTYNFIDFFKGGTLVDTVVGTGNGSNQENPTVMISDIGGAGGLFDSVRFRSVGSNAFEYDSLTVSAVPVPASSLMLLGALAGLAGLRNRRRKA